MELGGLIKLGEHIHGLDMMEMAIKHELGRTCLRRDGTMGRKREEGPGRLPQTEQCASYDTTHHGQKRR
jgi:hypothetical protein